MRWLFAFLVCVFASASAIGETRIVSGKSDENLTLNATFNGKDILVYGAIVSDDSSAIDVIMVVRGPDQSIKINKKSRKFGFWLIDETIDFRDQPSYLAVLSSWGLETILSPSMRNQYDFGVGEHIDLTKLSGNVTRSAEFKEALIRIRKRNHQFVEQSHGVRVQDGVLFSADVPLPANLIEGVYTFDIYVVQNQKVTAHSVSSVPIRKTGIGRWLFKLADSNGFLYGLLCVALSIIVALIATQAIRLVRR